MPIDEIMKNLLCNDWLSTITARMKTHTFTILMMLAITSSSFVMAASSPINPIYHQCDSIRHLLPRLKGTDKLDALEKIMDLAYYQDDIQYELHAINTLIVEAHRQGDIDKEAYGRGSRTFCYSNYSMEKEMRQSAQDNADFFTSNQLWTYYYEEQELLVDMYIFSYQYNTALRAAKEVYNHARQHNSRYGLGVAIGMIGLSYMGLSDTNTATKYLEKSIRLLSPYLNSSSLYDFYGYYCDQLYNAKQYAKLKKETIKWLGMMDKYMKSRKGVSKKEIMGILYSHCYVSMAMADMETHHLNSAGKYLTMAKEMREGRSAATGLSLLSTEIRYYQLKKNYAKALDANSKLIEYNKIQNDLLGLINSKEQRADILDDAGRGNEAAKILFDIIPQKDSITTASHSAQLIELSTLYGLDEAKLEQRNMRNMLIIITSTSILLILLLILYIIHLQRIRHKNHILYENVLKRVKEEETANRIIPNADILETTFHKLCTIMRDESLYKDPQLGRDQLMRRLGLNANNFAEMIQNYSNCANISEYINNYRLYHAVKILIADAKMPISEIGCLSGFNSRNAFTSNFSRKYGISPSEFRKISKEEQEKITTQYATNIQLTNTHKQ